MEDLEAIRGVEGGLKAFAEEALERSLRLGPSDQAAFKALFTRLYSRQVDGTLTTWLAPRDALEKSWSGSRAVRPGGGSGRVGAPPARGRAPRRGGRASPVYPTGPRCPGQGRCGLAGGTGRGGTTSARESQGGAGTEETARANPQAGRRGSAVAAGLAIIFGATGLWAVHQKTLALRSKVEAQESLRVACKGLDDLLTEVADVDLAEIPQMESVRRLLLEKARSGYDSLRLRATAENDPELRWVTARAYGRLGDIDAMLGDFEQAERSYRPGDRTARGAAGGIAGVPPLPFATS